MLIHRNLSDKYEDTDSKVAKSKMNSSFTDTYYHSAILEPSQRLIKPTASQRDVSPSQDASFLLNYALHYEVKHMRRVWTLLVQFKLNRQLERKKTGLAYQTYIRKLLTKSFLSLHKYYLSHFGHKFAKQ